MVTGYEEAVAVYNDTATFSSCNAVTGPFPGFPVPLVGDDVSALIDEHRDELPMSDQLPTLDPPKHTAQRALLMRLITPKRLKENEEFMWRLADRQLDEFVANGECEFITDYAGPFAMLVIADLLGVPESGSRDVPRRARGEPPRAAPSEAPATTRWCTTRWSSSTTQFSDYVEDRRREPARRRAHRPGDGDVPRRLDARGHRRRAHRRQPVRGRPGDDRAAARQRALQLLGEDPDLQQLAA